MMKTYYMLIESKRSASGEIVGKCSARSLPAAIKKFGFANDCERASRNCDVLVESDVPTDVYDPKWFMPYDPNWPMKILKVIQ